MICIVALAGVALCQSPTLANTGVSSTTVRIVLEQNIISAGEPVLVDVKIHAPASSSIDFDPGYDDNNVDLSVIDPIGRVFARQHVTHREGMRFSEAVHVKPGEESVFTLLANDGFSFNEPGHYVVDVLLRGTHGGTGAIRASLPLQVRERDASALRQTCTALLDRITDSKSFTASLIAARALSSVKDQVAVPYISAAVKRREFASLMIDALARARTEEALEALKVASESNDSETSSLARAALVALKKPGNSQ